jgi:hypothetical protein
MLKSRIGAHLSLEQFIGKWTVGAYPPTKVEPADLGAAEARLDFVFPQDYRTAILAHGLPWMTIALLHSICETEAALFDVSEFFEPNVVVEQTQAWRAGGLPDNLIAFASDCSGNLFCFDARRARDGHTSKAPVWFWNHDDGDLSMVADSFSFWIEQFCGVDYVEWDTEA